MVRVGVRFGFSVRIRVMATVWFTFRVRVSW